MLTVAPATFMYSYITLEYPSPGIVLTLVLEYLDVLEKVVAVLDMYSAVVCSKD